MCGQDDTLHHKKVLPILGIHDTDTTYYLSHLLSFKFIVGLRDIEGNTVAYPHFSTSHG